jgi:hypothetical protein
MLSEDILTLEDKVVDSTDIQKELAKLNALQRYADNSFKELHPEQNINQLEETLSKEIKNDKVSKLITFFTMLSAYTHSNQLNVSFNASSSTGKTHITTSLAKLFPPEDRIELNSASPTALRYKEGVKDEETGATIVDLSRKILIFYEVPGPELQKTLRSVLSHDSWENRSLMTNKDKKGANRAQEIIIRGFPATIFCSAGLRLDEQEATRAILLSPETTQEKLTASIHFSALRNSGDTEFLDSLENDPDILKLKKRIEDIRLTEVDDVYIPNLGALEKRFTDMVGKAKPRHSRDIDHLLKLIKAITIFNVWHRRDGDKVIATQSDIDQALELWKPIVDSQDQNIPPMLLDFYRKVIVPAFNEKLATPEYKYAMENGAIGLNREELCVASQQKLGQTLNWEYYRHDMQPQLEASSLIDVRKPETGDRRSYHVFPLLKLKTI